MMWGDGPIDSVYYYWLNHKEEYKEEFPEIDLSLACSNVLDFNESITNGDVTHLKLLARLGLRYDEGYPRLELYDRHKPNLPIFEISCLFTLAFMDECTPDYVIRYCIGKIRKVEGLFGV